MEIAGDRSAAGGRGIRPHLARMAEVLGVDFNAASLREVPGEIFPRYIGDHACPKMGLYWNEYLLRALPMHSVRSE
jgi:hypothetical protein